MTVSVAISWPSTTNRKMTPKIPMGLSRRRASSSAARSLSLAWELPPGSVLCPESVMTSSVSFPPADMSSILACFCRTTPVRSTCNGEVRSGDGFAIGTQGPDLAGAGLDDGSGLRDKSCVKHVARPVRCTFGLARHRKPADVLQLKHHRAAAGTPDVNDRFAAKRHGSERGALRLRCQLHDFLLARSDVHWSREILWQDKFRLKRSLRRRGRIAGS